jgi:hypothetical protein
MLLSKWHTKRFVERLQLSCIQFLDLPYKESRGLPTKYEDPQAYNLIRHVDRSINIACSRIDKCFTKRKPFLGTLPLGILNALATKEPKSGNDIVLFNRGTFPFLHIICKVIARAMPVGDNGHSQSTDLNIVARFLDKNPEITGHLLDLFNSYLIAGNASYADPYRVRDVSIILSGIFLLAAESFILGHEYGHLSAGHMDMSNEIPFMLGNNFLTCRSMDWEDEFRADYLGMTFAVLTSLKAGTDTSLAFAGIDLFFSSMIMVERALKILLNQSPFESIVLCHPPFSQRQQFLRENLHHFLPAEKTISALDLSKKIQSIANILWERVQPALIAMRKSGKKPAKIWSLLEKKSLY